MTHCKVHNVCFYTPEPRAIYCFALDKLGKKLALSRSDASIEIWNLSYSPFMEKCLVPSLENFSVEGLCWADDHLFSVGLHGYLIEYDLYKLCPKNKWLVTGEAATCLAVDKTNTRIAVGTELGYINLFNIQKEGLDFDKFLDKQEGRIVCIKFDHTGQFLVTGSLNAVRVWNVNSGHAIHKMQLGRSEAKKDTIVWCLEVAQDFTIFTGDSRGVLTLWDGKMGAQIENYQSHQADILTLCLSDCENSLYCAGVDPLITNYMKINVKDQVTKWVKSIHRKIHDHDVRAMVLLGNKLFTGGLDSYMTCSYHPPKTLIKIPPLLYGSCVRVAREKRLILLRYPKHIEVWSLAESEPTDDNYRGQVQLRSNPRKLLVVARTAKNWNDEQEEEGITFSDMSKDGRWIIMSTNLGFRLYRLSMENDQPSLTRTEDLKGCNTLCVQAIFNNDASQLICALNDGTLAIYDLIDDEASLAQTIDCKTDLADTLSFLVMSGCGKYLVAADHGGNISIWDKRNDGWRSYTKLPRHKAPLTALGMHPVTTNLVAAYADGKVIEYAVKTRRLTHFCLYLTDDVPQWKTKGSTIRNITFDPRTKHVLILHDDANILIVQKNKRATTDAEDGEPSAKKAANGNAADPAKIKVLQKYKHLVDFRWIDEDESLAVEVNPLAFLEKLPPAFAQKTFGTK